MEREKLKIAEIVGDTTNIAEEIEEKETSSEKMVMLGVQVTQKQKDKLNIIAAKKYASPVSMSLVIRMWIEEEFENLEGKVA